MEKRERPLKVIVCGTNFGRVYLKGVARAASEFQLAGILSTGSRQSQECARDYQVRLYTDVAHLNRSLADIVCIAVKSSVTGGPGTRIAVDCLQKGISVLQEQPVHYHEVCECFQTAIKHNCHYMVNSFYANIKAGRKFIAYARQALQFGSPLYLDAECSMQVLYPLVDLIGQALDGLSPWSIRKTGADRLAVLTSLEGNVKGIPFTLRVENRMVPGNPDNYALLFHRITLSTPSGKLTLEDTNGLVLWNPRFFVPHTAGQVLDLYGDHPFSQMPVVEIINKEDLNNCYRDVYGELWPDGIAAVLTKLAEQMGKPLDRRMMQYQINVSRMWKDIGSALGPAACIDETAFRPVTLREFERKG